MRLKSSLKNNNEYFKTDDAFLSLFSDEIRSYNKAHFSPLEVARKASEFLCINPNSKILDIGSGIGKFCFVGAFHSPHCEFVGVEQRSDLHEAATQVNEILGLHNVSFKHANIDQIDFLQYDHFYFFNSFHEQLEEAEKMNAGISHDQNLYYYYNRFFYKQLQKLKSGARLACFFTVEDEIPSSFILENEFFGGTLKCYVKL